jgi:hypothetical protein
MVINIEDLLEESDEIIFRNIANGFDVKSEDQYGRFFLELLVKDNRIDLIKRIHFEGYNIFLKDEFGTTNILYDAVSHAQLEIVEFLINQGINVNGDEPGGFSPLMVAARSRHEAIVKFLLEKGAEVNLQTEHGMTALHFATQANSTEMANMLLQAGADPTIKNDKDISSLHHVIELCNSESDFNRNLGKSFCKIFNQFSEELDITRKSISESSETYERLKIPFFSVLKRIEGPILLERGNLLDSWGECTIISSEGVSYEPGGDTQILTAETVDNKKLFKLNLYGDPEDSDYFENMEDAENAFMDEIIANSGRPNFEKWEDMSLDELKYWCQELNLSPKEKEPIK